MASKLVHDAQSMRREMDNQEQTNNLSDMRIEPVLGGMFKCIGNSVIIRNFNWQNCAD